MIPFSKSPVLCVTSCMQAVNSIHTAGPGFSVAVLLENYQWLAPQKIFREMCTQIMLCLGKRGIFKLVKIHNSTSSEELKILEQKLISNIEKYTHKVSVHLVCLK